LVYLCSRQYKKKIQIKDNNGVYFE